MKKMAPLARRLLSLAKRIVVRAFPGVRSWRQRGGVEVRHVVDSFPLRDRPNAQPSGPVFTIVIPTMDRAFTLDAAIRSCLSQDDENLRLIVSDNASTDGTAEVVASFSDPRIKYVNPGQRLGMPEHWEFALKHVEPGYVTVLGDDDGFLPGAVRSARALIERHGAKALAWRKVDYHWPDYIIPGLGNWLCIPFGEDVVSLNGIEEVTKVAAFRSGYTRLPCIYNSFVSTDIIELYRGLNGGVFFGGTSPDLYSGLAVATQVETYLYCERPLAMNAASSKSNGTLQVRGAKDDVNAALFWSDTAFRMEPGIPNSGVIELAIVDAFLKVQRVVPKLSSVSVDEEQAFRSAIGATFGGGIPESRRQDRLAVLEAYASFHGCLALLSQVRAEVDVRRSQDLPKPGYYPNMYLVYDASMLAASDVFEVAARVEEILSFREKQPALFACLSNLRHPEIGIALVARARGDTLRLNLGCRRSCRDGYVNIGVVSGRDSGELVADLYCDPGSIDLPTNSVSEICLGNFLEGLSEAEAEDCIDRWRGWLLTGGTLNDESGRTSIQ